MNSQFDPGEWLEGLLGFFNAAIRGFLPRMILAIAALMLGWLVAVLVRRLLRSVLRWMKVDQVYDRSGMKMAMEKTGVRGSLVSWIAQGGYLLTIIAFIRLALVQIGLEEMVGAIDKVFAFIPTLLVVLLILLGGGILQNYLGKAATVAARGMGLDHPTGFGRVASALVIVLVAILALTQFGIETGLIENIIVVLLACLGLGAAISFGFGTRDYTKEIVAGLYTRRIVEIGEKIEVEGRSGTLMAISPITTLLKDSNGLFSVQNSIVLYNLNVPDATAAKEHE